MTGYSKLFGSIVASTIWREDDSTRLVWITMLAIKNGMDVVEASIPGLADLARVSLEDTLKALEKLRAPDPYSRSQDHEGRRIADVPGGWKILNGEKYRQKMNQDERREYFRIKQQQHRERKKYEARDEQPTPGSSDRPVDLPPGFPANEAEAIAVGAFIGATPELCSKVWNKAMSRNGYDAKGQPIRSFRHYLATEKGYADGRKGEKKSKSGPNETPAVGLVEFERMREKLCGLFKRKAGGALTFSEQGALAEICRREGHLLELSEIEGYRKRLPSKEARYFPQSLGRLLENWTDTLDRARQPKPENSSL